MRVREKSNNLVSIYLWFVLRHLDQHHKEYAESRALKIGDLALHRDDPLKDRRRLAEALAMPMMNFYSALGRVALKKSETREQVKQKIVGVLMDREKTIKDLVTVFSTCFEPPRTGHQA